MFWGFQGEIGELFGEGPGVFLEDFKGVFLGFKSGILGFFGRFLKVFWGIF